jgi:molybdenum cofactor cytidylyltransferase
MRLHAAGIDMGCLLKAGGGLNPRLVVGAVLLAAGAGSRLGNRPKAMLELGGVPLIRRALIALSGAGVDEVVVVTGHHAVIVEPAVREFPVTIAHNPHPDDGQASSVITGLAALSGRLDAVVVALADQPLVNADDIAALIRAFKQREGAAMVVPRVDGEPGNPVIFDAALRDEWLAGGAEAACRHWRERHPGRVRWLDVANAHYRVDIDTADDLRRFAQRTGHALRWPAALAPEGSGLRA